MRSRRTLRSRPAGAGPQGTSTTLPPAWPSSHEGDARRRPRSAGRCGRRRPAASPRSTMLGQHLRGPGPGSRCPARRRVRCRAAGSRPPRPGRTRPRWRSGSLSAHQLERDVDRLVGADGVERDVDPAGRGVPDPVGQPGAVRQRRRRRSRAAGRGGRPTAVPSTVAPRPTASCAAIRPTPPATPWISTVSPLVDPGGLEQVVGGAAHQQQARRPPRSDRLAGFG